MEIEYISLKISIMQRVLQIYATVVCVIAIITMLITVTNLASGYFDKSDPLRSGWQDNNLSSFETFKLETMRGLDGNNAYLPDDQALRNMYEAAKGETLAQATHRINRDLMVNGLLLIIAIVLFIIHWFIIRRGVKPAEA